jgi:putative SOS response-associated peptidase YedK
VISSDVTDFGERFQLRNVQLPLLRLAAFNVTPRMHMPVVLVDGERLAVEMRWGLIPSWAKEASIGDKMINARGETVAEKPSFRGPFQRSRCLVPASGFYEWQKTAGGKVPHFVHLADEDLFAMAGLYDTWTDPAGEEVKSYTIITTTANAMMAPIHQRMPVILGREDEEVWLDPETPAEVLQTLLRPFNGKMDAYPVSKRVNRPDHDDPSLIEPVERDQ